jgi:hypothetical protein
MATATMDETDNLEELREQYRKLRRNAKYGADMEVWDAAVADLAVRRARKAGLMEPTPEMWIAAAEDVTVECEQCHGSGMFYWGAVVNGKPTHGGPCFRCAGAGRQGPADFARNQCYDGHRKVY